LSINRPRRIFRSILPRLDAQGVLIVLGAGLVAVTGVALAMLPRHEPAPLPPLTVAKAEALDALPTQVAVIDGGTLRMRDRVVLLQGVEPPPRDTASGAAAANALAALVREAPVVCHVTGTDELGRPYAICRASGTELNHAIVAAGWAHADSPELRAAEDAARTEHLGIWSASGAF
jgi:endonuclease YncB( thermonuclease family)